MQLAGRVALVTGGSRGIGAAICRRLAADGAAVVVNYTQNEAAAANVVQHITDASGKALAVQADITQPEQIQRLFAVTKEHFGKLDILINNAGIAAMRAVDEIDSEHIDQHFALNVKSLLLCCQAGVRSFPTIGGVIINISSNISRGALPKSSVYTATKGAVNALTMVLAAELGPRQIRVNAVLPGFTETDLNADRPAAERDWLVSRTALGRLGTPDDIAGMVAFLCSDAAHWITGELIGATGGLRL